MAGRKVATVFGGSGFIGRYVVQRLAQQDYVVRVAVRDPAGARFLQTQGRVGQIVPLAASVTDAPAVARAVEGAEVVVNLVGILFERRPGDFQRIQGDAPGAVAQAAKAAGVESFVHLSAIGADAASPSLYARSKAAGEAGVRAAFPEATILRPSVVFGPEDGFFNRFAGMAMLPFMPVVAGATRFQPVYVGDVAEAVAAALARPEARGRTYELGGPRVMTMREVLRFILETTRRRRPMVDMPMGFMRWQAGLLQRLPKPPVTQDQLLLLERDNVVAEGAPGLADLGIAAKAVETVVPGYLKRFRPGGGRREAG
ncbi:complex I NDUFA9 subunit family protein [Falsiroseomonas oryzae]|uniref:complex I NDUFA9 subunit family protein n=1 Tax=Falsiroseomonas oryzae TaxID=2766473 RepID=UPI0022EB3AC7|nr:complex I NDUFA9 subunit family protein [Roseomonas sp. MO-31]